MKNKQASWFTNKTERLYWEQWYINLHVAQHSQAHSGKTHPQKTVVDPGGTINCDLYYYYFLPKTLVDPELASLCRESIGGKKYPQDNTGGFSS